MAGSGLVPTNVHTPLACRREVSLSPASGRSSLPQLQVTGLRMMQAHKHRRHSTLMGNAVELALPGATAYWSLQEPQSTMWWQVQQVSSRLLQLHELLGSSKDIDVASMLIREPRQALGLLPPEGAAVFCICCSGCGLFMLHTL